MQNLLYLKKYLLIYKKRFFLGVFFIFLSNYFAIYPAQLIRKGIEQIRREGLANAQAKIKQQEEMIGKISLLMILSPIVVFGQSDGNPHNWDRRRRCDQIDYDPPCGICEVRSSTETSNKQINNKTTRAIKN